MIIFVKMIKTRIISSKEIKSQFTEKEIKEIEKERYSIPEIIELESDKWIARYYDTHKHNISRSTWGDQLIDITDKKTGFRITKFVADLGRTSPLSKLIEASGCELYKDSEFFKNIDSKILEETIDSVWKDLTMEHGLTKIIRYNGIIVEVGD